MSCHPENKKLFEFDPRSLKENEITLSEIADDIIYIPLDSKYPIDLVQDQIRFINNSVYLLVLNDGIFEFDKEGKLLRKIGSLGRGPGEINYLSLFAVDEKNETIYILDSGKIIKVFSRTRGFLRSFSLKEYGDIINAIEFNASKLFVSFAIQYENTKYEWIAFDTLGNVINKKEKKSSKFISNALPLGGIYKHENLLTFWNNYSDTVFSILSDFKSKPSFIISPGEHRLPKSRISAETMSQYMWLQQIFETEQFIIIRYFYPSKKFDLVLIDKTTNKQFLINLKLNENGTEWTGGILNDLDDGPNILPKSYFVENGREYIVGLIYPYQILSQVKSDDFKNSIPKYPEKKKALIRLADNLKETDNPILIQVRLKK